MHTQKTIGIQVWVVNMRVDFVLRSIDTHYLFYASRHTTIVFCLFLFILFVMLTCIISNCIIPLISCRPYCTQWAGSHSNSEANKYKARIVPCWGTAREPLGVDSFTVIFAIVWIMNYRFFLGTSIVFFFALTKFSLWICFRIGYRYA